MDRVIPSVTGAGKPILHEVLDHLKQCQWGPQEIFGVHVAMEEALVNAIKHGNRFDQTKQVHVACKLSPSRLHIEIGDEGSGFNPANVPDPTDVAHLDAPGGRGILLMRNFMSRVEYNATGNRVVLEKRRISPR
jgi:serine/threonine-protein kinase RsbW